jgi:hypothetical protein
MRAMRQAGWHSAMLLVLSFVPLAGQSAPQPAAPLNWSADDGKRVEELTAKGERREGKLAVLFTPAGAVDDAEETALLARLDKGLAELRAVIGNHAWQVVRAEKISYYVSSDRFVSHASGRGAVFVPLVRLQDGRAPYLHEAAHELLASFSQPVTPDPARAERVRTGRPLWLTEGLADYTALTAASRAGVKEGDVFDIGGLAGADAACRERLKGPRGAEILPFIGAIGGPAALFTTERAEVAPTFYACGTSFTKFVVGRIGLAETLALMPLIATGEVLPRIEKVSGTTVDALRTEWRAAIGGQ